MRLLLPTLTTGLLSMVWMMSATAQNAARTNNPDVPPFKIRPGYQIELVAQNIGEARFLEFGDDGTLYVSQPRAGTVVALRERDGRWNKIADFTTNKPTVHGLCFHDGWLWFTQSGAVWKARDTDGDGKADEEIKITSDLPSNGTHWWRSILVTSTHFYTSIGDSGNITDEVATERQKIWRFNLDGSGKTLFASGLRNTEKLRLRPGTDEIWGLDHGSDGWGRTLGEQRGVQPFTDHLPGEKINHYVEGAFYGHPFIVGAGLPRLEFKDRPDLIELATKMTMSAWTLPAHWACNGWNFIRRDALGLRGDAVVACHGSWNSTLRVGYRVERVMFDPMTGSPMGNQVLVSTLADDQLILGRPCDIAEAPDGSIFFTDDSKGRIYRLSRDLSAEANRQPPRPTGVTPSGPVARTERDIPAPTPQTNAPPVATREATNFKPLTYYQNQCARCHGDYGSTYTAEMKGKWEEKHLRETVLLMTEGPAQAPITAPQREAIVDYLRSLRDGRPYGTVLVNREGVLSGEASPGSKLWIESGAGATAITLEGHTWQMRVPPGLDWKDARLHVQKDENEVTVPLTERVEPD